MSRNSFQMPVEDLSFAFQQQLDSLLEYPVDLLAFVCISKMMFKMAQVGSTHGVAEPACIQSAQLVAALGDIHHQPAGEQPHAGQSFDRHGTIERHQKFRADCCALDLADRRMVQNGFGCITIKRQHGMAFLKHHGRIVDARS